jgi:hypothetical protein
MSVFHDSVEWKNQLLSLVQKVTPGQDIPYSVLEEFLAFFNTPCSTWKIPYAHSADTADFKIEAAEITSLTEQVVLQETRQYLWSTFYNRLCRLEYDKGEVFHIQHAPLSYPEFKDVEKLDDFPPHSLIYEGCVLKLAEDKDAKFLRIWNVNLPNLPRYTFEEGESFTQYFEYAKQHIPAVAKHCPDEETLYQAIVAEKNRHHNEPYATVAGQRDVEPFSILYLYWGTEFFFSAELFLNEDEGIPSLGYNPHLYPYPVQYMRAKNFRKFRYLITEN